MPLTADIGENIKDLRKSKTKRSKKQILAIALSAARKQLTKQDGQKCGASHISNTDRCHVGKAGQALASRISLEELEERLRDYGSRTGKSQAQLNAALAKARAVKGKPLTDRQVAQKEAVLKDFGKKFSAWDDSGQKKAWIESDTIDRDGTPMVRAYVRKGSYTLNGKRHPSVIQLANIEIGEEMRGQGVFTSVIRNIERKHPDKPIMLEEVSENSIGLAKKNGFAPDPTYPGNWYKMPSKKDSMLTVPPEYADRSDAWKEAYAANLDAKTKAKGVFGNKRPGNPCGNSFISADKKCSDEKKAKTTTSVKQHAAKKYREFKGLAPKESKKKKPAAADLKAMVGAMYGQGAAYGGNDRGTLPNRALAANKVTAIGEYAANNLAKPKHQPGDLRVVDKGRGYNLQSRFQVVDKDGNVVNAAPNKAMAEGHVATMTGGKAKAKTRKAKFIEGDPYADSLAQRRQR
jgi:hypothetical protein